MYLPVEVIYRHHEEYRSRQSLFIKLCLWTWNLHLQMIVKILQAIYKHSRQDFNWNLKGAISGGRNKVSEVHPKLDWKEKFCSNLGSPTKKRLNSTNIPQKLSEKMCIQWTGYQIKFFVLSVVHIVCPSNVCIFKKFVRVGDKFGDGPVQLSPWKDFKRFGLIETFLKTTSMLCKISIAQVTGQYIARRDLSPYKYTYMQTKYSSEFMQY